MATLHVVDPRFMLSSIYVLKHPDHPEVYIGSTILPLQQRLNTHIYTALTEKSKYGKLYARMLETGAPDWTIELERSVSCRTRAQLEEVEARVIASCPPELLLNVQMNPRCVAETNLVRRVQTCRAKSRVMAYENGKYTVSWWERGRKKVYRINYKGNYVKVFCLSKSRTKDEALALAIAHCDELAKAAAAASETAVQPAAETASETE